MAARTVARSASTPRRWPSMRGRPRRTAQRPLPSMITPTWDGTPGGRAASACLLSFSRISSITFSSGRAAPTNPQVQDCPADVGAAAQWRINSACRLHLHNFLFFHRQGLIDLVDELIGRLLHFGLMALFVVLADGLLLERLLERIKTVAADMAH